MYRVIQVSEGQLDGQTEGSGAISGYPATQSMTQAVIQGAFTSDDAVDAEGTAAETHYTYFPSTAVGDGAGSTASGSTAAVVTTQGSEALLGQATPPGTGQFFVMMSPQEVLQGGSQRSIAPRTHPYSPKSEAPRTTRDEKRRAQHNEVERRRRDKINNWIVQLSKIIPDCSVESTKSGQVQGAPGAKAASCPKPATISRSCGRATTACQRSCRALTSCSWIMTCCASRWRISRTRTCCCVLSCATTGWRSSSRMTATNFEGNIGLKAPHPLARTAESGSSRLSCASFLGSPPPSMELGAQRSGFGHGPGVMLVDLQGIALATHSRQPSHVPECRRLCALGACVWEQIQ
ncbi:upstream stimulatory factor 1 isoform X2 [Erinaceus europaeus]|nr:upstream stimulatory factor 1 isoform X2 [Erinaceus europaeus]